VQTVIRKRMAARKNNEDLKDVGRGRRQKRAGCEKTFWTAERSGVCALSIVQIAFLATRVARWLTANGLHYSLLPDLSQKRVELSDTSQHDHLTCSSKVRSAEINTS
jgi:hypothetical protein